MASRKMPAQKPGRSKQDYATEKAFIDAVEHRFGLLAWDLAADAENAVTPGRFFDVERDALKQDWHPIAGWLWLNPPYSDIGPWAAKCAEEMKHGATILLLTPASVGAGWFHDHIVRNAHVIELRDRICFDGKNPFPKDLILSVFAHRLTGRSSWRWKQELARAKAREDELNKRR